jgi:hypothetical protein
VLERCFPARQSACEVVPATCYIPQKVVLDYAVLTSTRQERPLDPRYRRILSFGDVLDESIGLFRHHWLVYATVSAACLLPAGVISVLLTLGGAFDTRPLTASLAAGEPPDFASLSGLIAAISVIYVIAVLFYLAWTIAVLLTTDDFLHATAPSPTTVLMRTLLRYPRALLGGVIYVLALLLVALAAGVLFTITVVLLPIFLLGGLGVVIGLVVWWVKPTARTPWLKWLIILATPFGLAMYIAGLWSLWLPATVLEARGPIDALRRSRQLIDRHWFRVVAVLFVAGMIVSVLQYIPTLLVELPLGLVSVFEGRNRMGPTETAISTAVGVMTQILFASMGSICYAVVFVDLRNRREGTDIAERLSQLETAAGLHRLSDVSP